MKLTIATFDAQPAWTRHMFLTVEAQRVGQTFIFIGRLPVSLPFSLAFSGLLRLYIARILRLGEDLGRLLSPLEPPAQDHSQAPRIDNAEGLKQDVYCGTVLRVPKLSNVVLAVLAKIHSSSRISECDAIQTSKDVAHGNRWDEA
jgi:hypothetical protein